MEFSLNQKLYYNKVAEIAIPGSVTVYPEITCDRIVLQPYMEYDEINSVDVPSINISFDGIDAVKASIDTAIEIINQSNKYVASKERIDYRYTEGNQDVLVIEPVDRSTVISDFIIKSPFDSEWNIMSNNLLYPFMGIEVGPTNNFTPIKSDDEYGISKISFTTSKSTNRYHVGIAKHTTAVPASEYPPGANVFVNQFIVNNATDFENDVLKKIVDIYPEDLKQDGQLITNISKYNNISIEIVPIDAESPEKLDHYGRILTNETVYRSLPDAIEFFSTHDASDNCFFEPDKHMVATLSPHITVNKLCFRQSSGTYVNIRLNGTELKNIDMSNGDAFKSLLEPYGLTAESDGIWVTISNPHDDGPTQIQDLTVIGTAQASANIDNNFDFIVDGLPSDKTLVDHFIRYTTVTFDNSLTREFTNKLEIKVNDQPAKAGALKDWQIAPRSVERVIAGEGMNVNLHLSRPFEEPVSTDKIAMALTWAGTAETQRIDFIFNDKPPEKTVNLTFDGPVIITLGESISVVIENQMVE